MLWLWGGNGVGGYWIEKIVNPGALLPGAGLLDRAKKLAARRPVPGRAQSGNRPPRPNPPPARAATPPLAPPAPQPVSPFTRFDRLSDSLAAPDPNFQHRPSLFGSGPSDRKRTA